jgi:hypothetical protein
MAFPSTPTLADKYLTVYMADVSTASSAFVAIPSACQLLKIVSALGVAITGADAVLTVEVNGTAVTGNTWTITQSGSAPGDLDTYEPASPTDLVEGDVLEIISDGASSTTAPMIFTVYLRET